MADGNGKKTAPGASGAAANITASGSPEGAIFSIAAAHTYAQAGTYAYTVTVKDDGGTLPVEYGGVVPDVFKPGIQVVVEGHLTNGLFKARFGHAHICRRARTTFAE